MLVMSIINRIRPIRQTGVATLLSGTATIVGVGSASFVDGGALQAQNSIVEGEGIIGQGGSGALAAQASTVDGAGDVTTVNGGSLEADASTVDGAGVSGSTGTGSLEADASAVDGEGAGASDTWEVLATWDHGVSGNTATPINLTWSGEYSELLIIWEDVTKSASAQMSFRFSTDGGSSYMSTSGNYRWISDNGSPTNATNIPFSNESTTAARSGQQHLTSNIDAVPHAIINGRPAGLQAIGEVIGNSMDFINGVSVILGSGNFTGGKITVLGHP